MQPCPRQQEEGTMSVQLAHVSHWREDGTCSYCGSISADKLFEAIDKGYELGPTDKNYKVYVNLPDPRAGELYIVSAVTFDVDENRQKAEGWVPADLEALKKEGWSGDYKWMMRAPRRATMQAKFYFQHLTVDERIRFVELLNAKVLNIGYPGYFYRLPFFAVKMK